MNLNAQNQELDDILGRFARGFREKEFERESLDSDILMELLDVDPMLKVRHKQYFSRELGACWESLLKEARRKGGVASPYFFPDKGDRQWPCDIVSGMDCIDAKYRVGSGDNGTKKNLVANANEISASGYRPVLLILREDNRKSSLRPLELGGWTTFIGKEAFEYAEEAFGFDLEGYLEGKLSLKSADGRDNSMSVCSELNLPSGIDIWSHSEELSADRVSRDAAWDSDGWKLSRYWQGRLFDDTDQSEGVRD